VPAMDVLGAAATVAVMPAVHQSVGGAVLSAGVNMAMLFAFSLFTWWTFWDMDEEGDGDGQDEGAQSLKHPPPSFLGEEYKYTVNLAVAGPVGAGKSSLVNALRQRLPDEQDAAPVGVQAITTDPMPYSFATHVVNSPADAPERTTQIRIWDLPGLREGRAGVVSYIRELGLRYFDAVFIVYSDRATAAEVKLAEELEMFNVPHFAVRSQVDQDVDNEALDYEHSESEVLKKLKEEAAARGFSSVFLVSSRHPDKYDFQQLISSICNQVKARDPKHHEKDCPVCFEPFDESELSCSVCHWCGNAVCKDCALHLQGKLTESMCPFCRRWTDLRPKQPSWDMTNFCLHGIIRS